MTDSTDITWVRTPRRDGIVIAFGTLVLLLAVLLVEDPPATWEESIFRRLNELPHNVEWMLWVLQQMGSALVVPFAAVALWRLTRHWRPPVALLIGGFTLGWLAAKGVKAIVGRGRPAAILDDVILGFDVPITEIGFPSGHAVLVFTLVFVLSPYIPRRWRVASFVVATLVGLTRIYVGAHLPLDIVGGAAYGTIIGTVVNLVSGVPATARADSPDSGPPPTSPGIA